MDMEIVSKSLDGAVLNEEEIAQRFRIPLFSQESAMMLSAAREKSERASNGLAEVHAPVGLKVAPCPNNCLCCVFTAKNKVVTEPLELPIEEAADQPKRFQEDRANAIFVMSTADYPVDRFIEVSQEIRKSLRPETILVANVGDFQREQAGRFKDCGFFLPVTC